MNQFLYAIFFMADLLSIENEFQIAGIEIPFPQRDLHLKSVDTEAIKAFQQATMNRSSV